MSTSFFSNLQQHLTDDTSGAPDGAWIDPNPDRLAEIYLPNMSPYMTPSGTSFNYSISQKTMPLWMSQGANQSPDKYSSIPTNLDSFCKIAWPTNPPALCNKTSVFFNSVFEFENAMAQLMQPQVFTWQDVSDQTLAYYTQTRFGMLTYAPSLAAEGVTLASAPVLGNSFVFNWPLNLTSIENNPSRSLVWSQPYTDDVTKSFIISAFYPFDINGFFIGFQGVDIVLNNPNGVANVPQTDGFRPTSSGFVLLMTMNGDAISVADSVTTILFPGINTLDPTLPRNIYNTKVGNFSSFKDLLAKTDVSKTVYSQVDLTDPVTNLVQTWSVGLYKMKNPPWVTAVFAPIHELLFLGNMSIAATTVDVEVLWSIIVDASKLPLGTQSTTIEVLTVDTVTGECFSSRENLVIDVNVNKKINKINWVQTSSAGAIVCIIFITLGVSIILGLMAWVYLNRERRIVKASSPIFCEVILLGSVLGLISAYFWIGQPTSTLCQLRVWFAGIGFTTTFTALCIKNIRVYMIFNSKRLLDPKFFGNDRLMMATGAIVLVEVLYLAIWTGVDTIGPVLNTGSSSLAVDEAYYLCSFGSIANGALWYTFLATKMILIFIGIVVGVKNSGVEAEFNEASHIGLAMYNLIVVIILAFVLGGSLQSPMELLGLATGILTAVFLISPVLFIVPKMFQVFSDNSREPSLIKHSGTQHASSMLAGSLTATTSSPAAKQGIAKSPSNQEVLKSMLYSAGCPLCGRTGHGMTECQYQRHLPEMIALFDAKSLASNRGSGSGSASGTDNESF
ncbi:hypothetical protein HDU76_013830 [Blyttiomyces sp. JEL0837]|nr:hypothetical protein HDU76_013830 [Blyttiomyces sp. JEL0837]